MASDAANKANKASEDATNAVSKSSEAIENANQAKNTANDAVTAAGKATEIANSANTKSDQATDIANSAKQEASTASSIASEAKKTADKAQADTNANTKAVAQAQSAADAAKKAAADAQEKAENVESNLESANAVIEQHSNKLGELDTKVSNAVTNANSALTASTEAKQTATEASTTANTAYKDAQTAITNSTKATQTATEAKTTAESAVTTANDSLKQSSSAVQTANKIQNTLTTDYQTKADSDSLYATKSSLTETSESIKMEVSATYATKSTVEALQNVADNAIESWRGSGVPTSENKPASDWTTPEEKKRHSGDLYYDKDTGKAYRWGSDDGVVYSWVLNQDTDITKALQDASNAQKSANAAQSTANNAVTAAGNAQKSADGAQSTADSAKTAAANAQKTADTVQTDVDQLKIDIPNTYATKASLETTAESITAQVESVSTTANSAVTAASKAQQTADAINVNLTKNYQTKENADNTYATKASLSATSESLSTSITKAQQTADGAVNAASKAQQTADAININLTKNYQTTKDADDKYATQSSLNATADSITASVSKTYSTKTELTSAIDGISVGGRNLLTNTGDSFKPTSAWAQESSTWVPKGYCEYWRYDIPKTDPYYETKIGDVITISFDAEVYNPDGSATGWLALYNSNGTPSVSIDNDTISFPPNSVPKSTLVKLRGSATRTLKSGAEGWTNDTRLLEFYCGYGSGRYFKISKLKIERGNKATDWSPAPEDTINEAKTEITSAIDNIKVGATNFIPNSKDLGEFVVENPAQATWVNNILTRLDGDSEARCGIYYDLLNFDAGETYTFSIDINALSSGGIIQICVGSKVDGSIWTEYGYILIKEDGRHSFTFSTKSNETGIRLYIASSLPGTSAKITKAKFEKGNKPTDWSPAPEDLVAESKTYTDAQIKVTADSINSTVSSVKTTADSALSKADNALDKIDTIPGTYATKTEVNQTATDLTTTITTVQSTANEAKDTAESAKTSTNILETLIRQSEDGVEVAKKVNGEYTSSKTLMAPDGFYIKDSDDAVLTQVKNNSIVIGKETKSHIHINPDDVTILDGNETELARFYGNGLSLNSDALDIYSGLLDVPSGETIPITYMNAVGGFSFYSMLNDSIQTILPKNSNNKCMIAAVNDVHSNPAGYTVASSAINIKVIANAEGKTTNADSTASISIDSHSTLLNSSSSVSTGSTIVLKASDINLQAQRDLIIKGYTLKDFVKEIGTSTTTDGQWTTRTWKWRWIKTYSGKCFAWGECGFNVGCTTAWGSGYYDHVCPVYPFKLSEWNVQSSVSFVGGGIGHTGIYDDAATQCPIYIWSAVYQNTGQMFVKVFVEGVLA